MSWFPEDDRKDVGSLDNPGYRHRSSAPDNVCPWCSHESHRGEACEQEMRGEAAFAFGTQTFTYECGCTYGDFEPEGN